MGINRGTVLDLINDVYSAGGFRDYYSYSYIFDQVDTMPESKEDAEPHWIPVTERPPEVGKSVLICDAYGDICLGHRTHFGYYYPDFCDDKIKDVRAWCELLEPYKGVTE